jgi:hypothetical protein
MEPRTLVFGAIVWITILSVAINAAPAVAQEPTAGTRGF